jgi:retron-type reverse transcriptase
MGYNYVVDIDMAKFFDTLNHDMLIRMLKEQVRDATLIYLIRKFLKKRSHARWALESNRARVSPGRSYEPPVKQHLSNKV